MTRNTESTDDRTMKSVSHANPYTGETAGQLFRRGPTIVADGGRADAVDEESAEADDEPAVDDPEERTMKHVSHTPPNGSDGANRVFERGTRQGEDVEAPREERK
ncbi:hypothetical protein ACFQGT_08945 [Natrialbaceae archaeon GCM10025810]|uniref:hypothetical protein n=1 Tax=Halovalidus salilacus TaxID=3075124 RepID=UPI0036186D45